MVAKTVFIYGNRSPDRRCIRCVSRPFSQNIVRHVNLFSDRLWYVYVGLHVKL